MDAQRKRKVVYFQVNGNESNVKRAHSLRHKLTTLAAELCYFILWSRRSVGKFFIECSQDIWMLQRENKKVKKNNFFFSSCSGYLMAKSTFFIEWNLRYCKNYRQTKTWREKLAHSRSILSFLLDFSSWKSRVLHQYHNLFPMPLYKLAAAIDIFIDFVRLAGGEEEKAEWWGSKKTQKQTKIDNFSNFSLFSLCFFVLLAPSLWVECLLSYL